MRETIPTSWSIPVRQTSAAAAWVSVRPVAHDTPPPDCSIVPSMLFDFALRAAWCAGTPCKLHLRTPQQYSSARDVGLISGLVDSLAFVGIGLSAGIIVSLTEPFGNGPQ